MTKEKVYRRQMDGAKRRGIKWEFTLETWWAVWSRSRKWRRRGRGSNQFVMARFGDVGPYSPSNVYICTGRKNRRDFFKNKVTPEWAVNRAPKIKRSPRLVSAEKLVRYADNICSPIIKRIVVDQWYGGPVFLT